jgi:ATP-binding cassette subfamily B protein
MIAKHYGQDFSLAYLRERSYIDRNGVSLRGISEAAELIGLNSLAVKIPTTGSKGQPSLDESPLPAILHWNQNHFVVAYKKTKNYVWIADPSSGKFKLPIDEFEKSWISEGNTGGYDVTKTTTASQNPYSSNHSDRMHYDYCYDGRDRYEDYRGGNYTLP